MRDRDWDRKRDRDRVIDKAVRAAAPAEALAEALAEAEPGTQTGAEALTEAEPEMRAGAEALMEAGPEMRAGAEALTEAGPEMRAGAGALTEAEPETRTGAEALTDEKWRAIVDCDAAFDGRFFYAVKTTGIFCRPSCRSKPPNEGNVRLFADAERALAAGFRPCKRCRPTGRRLPDEEWAETAAAYIDGRYTEPLTLEQLADAVHGSPYHLHRTFKRVKGETPTAYMQRKRVERTRELLRTTELSVAEIGSAVGWANTSYFIAVFKRLTGFTPAAYRQRFASGGSGGEETEGGDRR